MYDTTLKGYLHVMTEIIDQFRPMHWQGDHLQLLDQRRLPAKQEWMRLESVNQVAEAIAGLAVRGAPAIGITAGYGAVLSARQRYAEDKDNWHKQWSEDCALLAAARPTAINLLWALQRLQQLEVHNESSPVRRLEQEAIRIHDEDITCNQHLASLGAALIEPGATVLTHCNTGALATGAIGTALGVIVEAHRQSKIRQVFADETRPWLQGSRLTLWELQQADIPCKAIVDGAGAWLMQSVGVDWLIVGADRVVANGDTANKIGTYHAMLAARAHGVKTMVVIPWSTLDMDTRTGADIPIEQREEQEILRFSDHQISPSGAAAWNPVFDVTPAHLVDFLVTDRGVIAQPDSNKIMAMSE